MRRRYEIVREGNTWTVGTGSALPVRGHLTSDTAVAVAIGMARDAEKLGQHISIYLWDRGTPTLVYTSPESA